MTSERKFIEENVKRVLLKEYLKRRTERSGFGGLDIQRTPMGTRVTLIAERPGMVIGRKGETIKELTDYVQNKFKFDNPQIEVKEVSNPNLNPHIMAQKLATALERGWHFRRAGHSTVRRIMSAGAKGCQVIISGKLTGQRHRTEKFREGHIKYCGETKLDWMHEGYAVAKKKLGVIGVKVQIMDPKAKLPDEIELRELKDVSSITVDDSETITEVVEDTEIAEGESLPDTTTETGEIDAEIEPEIKAEAEAEVEEPATKSTPKKRKSKKEKDEEKKKEKDKEKEKEKTKKEKEEKPKKAKSTKTQKGKEKKKEKVEEEKPEEDSKADVTEVTDTSVEEATSEADVEATADATEATHTADTTADNTEDSETDSEAKPEPESTPEATEEAEK
jgi:small subunit ribosomal protein S3